MRTEQPVRFFSEHLRRRGALLCAALLAAALVSLPASADERKDDADMEPAVPAWFEDFDETGEQELYELLRSGETGVASASLTQNREYIYLTLEDGSRLCVADPSQDLVAWVRASGTEVSVVTVENAGSGDGGGIGGELLSSLVILALFLTPVAFMLVRSWRSSRMQAVSAVSVQSGDTSSREGVPKVRFSDVEGVEDLKGDLMRIVDCLKNSARYAAIGARIPKGVILYGPPGTGKTLLARAVAGEAGVPFFSVSGSDFVEKYVGVGASRVRDLYKKAKKSAPCIVFIDEIDAVAGSRGQDGNSERDQTINALLTELDGFSPADRVVTICATNRIDMLDAAFCRAGRFDLQLAVGLPDFRSRVRILKIHTRNKRLSGEIDLEAVARRTQGFSGAELETLMNEAALQAAGRGADAVFLSDVEGAFFRIVMKGNRKPGRVQPAVAWHEAGHALATRILTGDSVPGVTVMGSTSGAGGVTFRAEAEEDRLKSRSDLEHLVQVMYAGRAAEEIFFGNDRDITVGASQDIRQATSVIKEYLSVYGMGKLGLLDLAQFRQDLDPVLEEASEMARRLYGETLEVLRRHEPVLRDLAEELLKKESLDEAEIEAVIAGRCGNSAC